MEAPTHCPASPLLSPLSPLINFTRHFPRTLRIKSDVGVPRDGKSESRIPQLRGTIVVPYSTVLYSMASRGMALFYFRQPFFFLSSTHFLSPLPLLTPSLPLQSNIIIFIIRRAWIPLNRGSPPSSLALARFGC